MDENKSKNISISIEVDMKTGQTVGEIIDRSDNKNVNDIAVKIAQRIGALFNSDGSDWIEEYVRLINDGSEEEAFDLLKLKMVYISAPISSEIITKLMLLNYKKLDRERQLKYLVTKSCVSITT
jgi:hypothetical protein